MARAVTLPLALQCVRPAGSIVALGVFSSPVVLDPLLLLAKEARIVFSNMYRRSGRSSDFAMALEVLRDEHARLSALVTHAVSLEEIERGFLLASDKRSGAIKVAVRPSASP